MASQTQQQQLGEQLPAARSNISADGTDAMTHADGILMAPTLGHLAYDPKRKTGEMLLKLEEWSWGNRFESLEEPEDESDFNRPRMLTELPERSQAPSMSLFSQKLSQPFTLRRAIDLLSWVEKRSGQTSAKHILPDLVAASWLFPGHPSIVARLRRYNVREVYGLEHMRLAGRYILNLLDEFQISLVTEAWRRSCENLKFLIDPRTAARLGSMQ